MTLSICIPTFNRASFLPATLDAIASQWEDGLEITVADNASTDGTGDLVREYQRRLGRVRYFRWDANQGADRNYLKAVELATSDYCWLLGSDDPIAPGAVASIRRALSARRPGILLFNRMLCDRDLVPFREDRFVEVGDAPETFHDFARPGELERYLGLARSMCATFSYLSSIVVRKQVWDAVPTDEDFIGGAYVHSYKLLRACADGTSLAYLNAPLVLCRLGNDSFRDLGLARRVLIDLHGYSMLAERCFAGRPACASALVGLLRREYPFARILRYQGVLGRDPQWPEIVRALREDVGGYAPMAIPAATALGRIRPLVRLSFTVRDWRQRRSARRVSA
jgi:abequosyltransferase